MLPTILKFTPYWQFHFHMPDDDDYKTDQELFRDAMTGVSRLVNDKQPAKKRKLPPRPLARFQHDSQQAFTDEQIADRSVDTPEWLNFSRPGIQRKKLQALQRGHIKPEWVLDLHGLFVKQARQDMVAFLNEAMRNHVSVVLIIHGKGFGSEQQPVLKQMLNGWLPQIPEVLAFCSAARHDGGTGAAYVLLKQLRDQAE